MYHFVQAEILSPCVVSCNSTEVFQVAKCQIDFKTNTTFYPGIIILEYPNHLTVRDNMIDPLMLFSINQYSLLIKEYQNEKIILQYAQTLTSDIKKVLVGLFNIFIRNPPIQRSEFSFFNLTIGNKSIQCERSEYIIEADLSIRASSKVISSEPNKTVAEFKVVFFNQVPIKKFEHSILVKMQSQQKDMETSIFSGLQITQKQVLIQDKDGITEPLDASINEKGDLRIQPSKSYTVNQEIKIYINYTIQAEIPQYLQLITIQNDYFFPTQKNYIPTQILNQNFDSISPSNRIENISKQDAIDIETNDNPFIIAYWKYILLSAIVLVMILIILLLWLTPQGNKVFKFLVRMICVKKELQEYNNENISIDQDINNRAAQQNSNIQEQKSETDLFNYQKHSYISDFSQIQPQAKQQIL
eukprot:403354095